MSLISRPILLSSVSLVNVLLLIDCKFTDTPVEVDLTVQLNSIMIISAEENESIQPTKLNDHIISVFNTVIIVFTDYVQPICLPDDRSRLSVGHDVFVAGWGKTLDGMIAIDFVDSPASVALGFTNVT